mmetsp:Transcript_12346/g.27231  ORF Transcript_12346/g.27231 Transcript_12346/m.27231 type:complete len:253 (+) Transcript_12346:354-1112(+)
MGEGQGCGPSLCRFDGGNQPGRRLSSSSSSLSSLHAPDSVQFGLFLTSQPMADIWEQGVAGRRTVPSGLSYEAAQEDQRLEHHGLLFESNNPSSADNNKNARRNHQPLRVRILCDDGPPMLPPSYQLVTQKSPLADYCWLVLLPLRTSPTTTGSGTGNPIVHSSVDAFYRSVEEERWAKIPNYPCWDICMGQPQVVIPLLCIANGNFRRPPRPRFQGAVGVQGPDENDVFAQQYCDAYQTMKSIVTQVLLAG